MRLKLFRSSYFPVWFVLAVRLFHLSLVRSWFVPDEYWQSLEVAHNLVFGYGYITWEWIEGIRSYIYVAFVSLQYALLKLLYLDYVQLVIFIPRLIQTLMSVLADVYLICWIALMSSRQVAILASIFTLTSACWSYCATRTLINTVEGNLTCFALYFYPWPHVKRRHETTYLWIVAISCLLRPTSCILWLPLCLYDIFQSRSVMKRVVYHFIPVGIICLGPSILLDSWFHGSFTLTPWNFLSRNIISGVSAHYSTQPWFWYLTAGIPSVLGAMTPAFYSYMMRTVWQRKCHHALLFATLVWTLLVYSCIGHKEFRFLLSLWPIMILYTSLEVFSWLKSTPQGLIYSFLAFCILIESGLLVYLSLFHQVGVLNVMSHLREGNRSQGVLFLMPCHSTPLYSHLHRNITTRFLTCEPNLSVPSSNYQDEADVFYSNPQYWLDAHYKHNQSLPTGSSSHDFFAVLPTTVVCFDVLVPSIEWWLRNNGFALEAELFHTLLRVESRIGNNVMVYSRSE
ncbi:hypothetical protein M8J77_003107 [Diaphorina citri]|nr:hypothetical protein M8J77_003107 [Diaphorina citri]